MNKRVAALLPAAALALLLAGCGSSDSGASEGSSADSDKSSSSSGSSESTEEAAPEATGADYRGLLAALLDQQAALQGATNAQQVNKKADFPQGVSVAEFDKASKSLCIENDPKAIALTFSSQDLVLHDGTCADGTDVATLRPQGKNDLSVSGDKALAEPVRTYFVQKFGS